MAVMDGVVWDPLPENATQTKIRPTQVILHTAVDAPGPTRLGAYFARADVSVESHFWVTLDGVIYQMMDSEVRADANRYANRRSDGTGAISVETEDEGDPVGVPWTAEQLVAILRIIRWANEKHGVPLVVCSGPAVPGVGYHAMWGAPSAWTPSVGKTCPGPTRVAQFEKIVVPAFMEVVMAGLSKVDADAFAKVLYGSLLDRVGDSSGLDYWSSVAQSAGATETLVAFMVSSKAEIESKVKVDAIAREAEVAAFAALAKRVAVLETRAKAGAQVVTTEAVVTAAVDAIVKRLAN